jgi:hypothetical protein
MHVFVLIQKSKLVILAQMKHHICGRLAILEWDVQPLEHEELNP